MKKLLLSKKELLDLLGIGKTKFKDMRKQGKVPPPIDFEGMEKWKTKDIEGWVDEYPYIAN